MFNKKYSVIACLIILFLFFRFYKISDSLFFFNDNGRDFLVLQQWQQTGKPPLLGPQNSALPINQSAIYFYLLYPAFLLTNQSPISPLIVNSILYIGSFIFCLLLTKSYPRFQKALLVFFFIISIHPQYIIQNRYIWNPSFVAPFLLLATTFLYLLKDKITTFRIIALTFSLATALSFSYSVLPVLLAIVIYYLITIRKSWLLFLFSLTASMVLLNAPTIFFEFRHNFLLTTSLFTKRSPIQNDLALPLKLQNLVNYGIGDNSLLINSALFVCLIIGILFVYRKSKNRTIPILLILSIILTLAAPFTLQSHYIFGILTLLFLGISFLPNIVLVSIIIILSLIYLNPHRLQSYFQSAPRTYDQMASCFKQVCQQETQPLFVTVQSSLHPYHYGPEHRYLMKRYGCDVREIEKDSQSANTMAVVVDGGDYTHNKTNYFELTLFGPTKQVHQYNCQNNFKVVMLNKI